MRVSEIATKYGTSLAFVRQALARLGFNAQGEDAWIPPATITEFEHRFGDRIRSSRPAPQSTAVPVHRSPSRAGIAPDPHIIRTGYEKVTGRRNPVTGDREKALDNPPGVAHAIDANGTWEGDPWTQVRRLSVIGLRESDPHFYDRGGPHAACGVKLRAIIRQEFTAGTVDACPRCAELSAAGEAYRNPPGLYIRPECSSILRLVLDGHSRMLGCDLRPSHLGPHESGKYRWDDEGKATRIDQDEDGEETVDDG